MAYKESIRKIKTQIIFFVDPKNDVDKIWDHSRSNLRPQKLHLGQISRVKKQLGPKIGNNKRDIKSGHGLYGKHKELTDTQKGRF